MESSSNKSILFALAAATTTTTTAAYLIHRFFFSSSSSRRSSTTPPFPPLDEKESSIVNTDNGDRVLKRGLGQKQCNLPKLADCIIIGSGPAGLTAASLLTNRGYKVLVLEQHDRAGGGLHSFVEKGKYEFDTGFHYSGELAPHEPLRKIVDFVSREDPVEWSPIGDCSVEPGIYDQVVFWNNKKNDKDGGGGNGGRLEQEDKPFNVPTSKTKWMEELKKTFPEDVDAIQTYFEEMEACAKTGLMYAIWRSLPQNSFLSRLLKPIMGDPAIYYNTQTAGDRLDQLTNNQRLKAVLGYISMGCCAVCPDELNYFIMLGLHFHFANGGYYPVNGASAVAAGMVKTIEKGGGRVLVRAAVDRVLVEEVDKHGHNNKRVKTVGVQLVKNGLVVKAPIVISTIGLRETITGLLRKPDDAGPDPINSAFSGNGSSSQSSNSTAGAVVDPLPPTIREELNGLVSGLPSGTGHIYGFVGIKADPNDPPLNLPKRNCWILPSSNLREGMDAFKNGGPFSGKPFGYVGLAFSSEKDPGYKDRYSADVITAAFVAGDVPWEWFEQWADTRVHKRGEDYEKLKESFKERLLDVLYMKYPQVKGKVKYVDLGTPVDTRTYLGRLTGASYGIPPTVAKAKADASWLRPKMPEFLPEGMYLAGHDITVDGFASALMSGLMCTAAIEGVLSWLDVVPMLGGWIETAKVLLAGV